MSETTVTPFDLLNMTEQQKIKSIINLMFFADYGIVTKVTGNTSVDVQHAIQSVTIKNQILDPLITKDVELMFLNMSGISFSGTVSEGDTVLLVGLRNVLDSTNISAPKAPNEFWHYSQQTVKAIPLSCLKSATISVGETEGKFFVRSSSKSLYTILNNLATHIKALQTNATTPITLTVSGSSATGVVPALTLDPSVISNLAQDIADLAALMGA